MKTEREIIVDQMQSLLNRATNEMKEQFNSMQYMLEDEEVDKLKDGLTKL